MTQKLVYEQFLNYLKTVPYLKDYLAQKIVLEILIFWKKIRRRRKYRLMTSVPGILFEVPESMTPNGEEKLWDIFAVNSISAKNRNLKIS